MTITLYYLSRNASGLRDRFGRNKLVLQFLNLRFHKDVVDAYSLRMSKQEGVSNGNSMLVSSYNEGRLIAASKSLSINLVLKAANNDVGTYVCLLECSFDKAKATTIEFSSSQPEI